jgi:hypothetical protein
MMTPGYFWTLPGRAIPGTEDFFETRDTFMRDAFRNTLSVPEHDTAVASAYGGGFVLSVAIPVGVFRPGGLLGPADTAAEHGLSAAEQAFNELADNRLQQKVTEELIQDAADNAALDKVLELQKDLAQKQLDEVFLEMNLDTLIDMHGPPPGPLP